MSTTEILKTEQRRPPTSPLPSQEPPEKKGHGWIWVLVILLLVGGAVGYSWKTRPDRTGAEKGGGGRGRGGPGGAGGGPVSVGTYPVLTQDVPFYLAGLGSVTPFYTVTVHSRVDGQLMKVYFQEGQFVHEGDALADIDPRPFQVALDQAQGQLAKDMASQSDAKIDLTRYQQLFNEGVIPRQQLDTQQAMVGQFDGAIQADKAQIDNEKLQLTYSHIVSPIDGRIGLRLVDPGNIVHAADANGMIVITQVRPIAVVFTLPEDNLPQVVAEMKNRTLEVEAYSRDNDSKLAQGKLQTIDNQIDQTTGTVKLKAEFANEDLSLWPNQFVNIRLFLTVKKDARVIPSAAIQNGSTGSFVYAVNNDSTVSVQPVTVDFSQGNMSVISKGLQPGQTVVVDGQDKLQGGAKISAHASTLNFTQGSGVTAPPPAAAVGAAENFGGNGAGGRGNGGGHKGRGDGSRPPNGGQPGQGSNQ